MNLHPVKAHPIDLRHPQTVRCVTCGYGFPLHTGYADIDGPPFVAFHCKPCGDVVVARQLLAKYLEAGQ